MNQLEIAPFHSLIEFFYHWVRTKPDLLFLRQPKGDDWKTMTYQEAYLEAGKMAQALHEMGLKKGDHVAILSKNCYHWILADLAIMMGGFVSIPLYYSLGVEQLNYTLSVSDSKAVFLGKLEKWTEGLTGAIPDGVQPIRFPHYEQNAMIEIGVSWDQLVEENEVIQTPHVPDPEELWTIMYTSGTTGNPKGVMHVHNSPAQIIKDELKNNWIGVGAVEHPRYFSYLPLNHVAEKIGIFTGAIGLGGSLSFGESLETFAKNLQDTQPQVFFAVPRIWTKFYLGVLQKMSRTRQNILFNIPILSSIVKKKIKFALGMGEAQIVSTGGAIAPAYLKKWYKTLGIHLIEAYGMTEVCGSISNSPMKDAPLDSVGKAAPGCEVKIDPETQEILMKSPYMMKGYYKDPELTNRILIDDWLHSGDIGQMDEEGFIRVTGRISDAFKTSKGRFVTPNPMEETISKNDLVEQVCITGIGIPQPVALVNLAETANELSNEQIEANLIELLNSLNAGLANYQKISTIIIDQNIWNTDNLMLTPTLKIRRTKINEVYGSDLLGWHEDKRQVIWA